VAEDRAAAEVDPQRPLAGQGDVQRADAVEGDAALVQEGQAARELQAPIDDLRQLLRQAEVAGLERRRLGGDDVVAQQLAVGPLAEGVDGREQRRVLQPEPGDGGLGGQLRPPGFP
jgi:hypothetical protein